MEPGWREETAAPPPDALEAQLDALVDYPHWDERRRDAWLERLIAGHAPEQLRAAILPRLSHLSGGDAEPLLRLVDALATPELLTRLAEALAAQPGLAPERAWPALALLDDARVLERYPGLAELWEELNETIEDDSSLDQLADQIEDDPEGLWLALQGLSAVEPDVRSQIISGLARLPSQPAPRVIEFLRLLCFAHDPPTRAAALEALDALPPSAKGDAPHLADAWRIIAAEHSDASIAERARGWLAVHDPGHNRDAGTSLLPRPRPRPRLVHSVVTALDGDGQGAIVLLADDGTNRVSAAFRCDVLRGVRHVFGNPAAPFEGAEALLDEIAEELDGRERVLDAPGLAEGLLKGCLLVCGPEAPPALQYWVEATLGPGTRPQPFPIPFPGWDPARLTPDEMTGRAELVLRSCPSWIDGSELTYDMAEEIQLREGDSPPDPRRDGGAYRYLFEHQLRGQLELYRRMLFWMASFWQAAGDDERGRSALALAAQLSDEQHEVPGHPFIVALSTRSLSTAQANLRAGIDPRRRRSPGG